MSDLVQYVADLNRALISGEELSGILKTASADIAKTFDVPFAGCFFISGGRTQDYIHYTGEKKLRFSVLPFARTAPQSEVRLRFLKGEEPHFRMLANAGLGTGLLTSISLGREDSLHVVIATGPGEEELGPMETQGLKTIASTLALGASAHIARTQSMYDPWLNVYNGRYVDLALRSELARAKRYHTALTIMAVQVDNLNDVVTKFGFEVGDNVVSEVSKILNSSTRTCDYVVRTSRDAFLMIMPATALTGVRRVTERIVHRVRKLSLGPAEWGLKISVSGGVAAAQSDSTMEGLLTTAAGLLGAARKEGGDRITFPGRDVAEFLALPSFLSTQDVVARHAPQQAPAPIPEPPKQ